MRKRLDNIIRGIILMLLGALIYGFISEAVAVYSSRSAGNIGGEVLILPLFAGLIWLGWQLKANFK